MKPFCYLEFQFYQEPIFYGNISNTKQQQGFVLHENFKTIQIFAIYLSNLTI